MPESYVPYPRTTGSAYAWTTLAELQRMARAKAYAFWGFVAGALMAPLALMLSYFARTAEQGYAQGIGPLVFGQVLAAYCTYQCLQNNSHDEYVDRPIHVLAALITLLAPCAGLLIPLRVASKTQEYFMLRDISAKGVRPSEAELEAWVSRQSQLAQMDVEP